MNNKNLIHRIENLFPVSDAKLMIGGIAVTELAQRVGQTPFYAYDKQRITQRVKQLKQALPAQIKLHYALKANPMPDLVQHLANLVDGFDLASKGEMEIALKTDMPMHDISFAGPGKSLDELRTAIIAGITISLESTTELERTSILAKELGVTPRVAIRVNPNFELKSSGMKMGGGPSPFGIDAEQVPEVLRHLKKQPLKFLGLHIFSGSQNLNANAIIEAQDKTVQLAYELAAHAPTPIRHVNIGGGFGIPYFPGETPLDLISIGHHLNKLLPEFNSRLPKATLIIELGRYLVGEAGVYVCAITDKKISRGQLFYITNGGLHHHLAASGNFGQVIRKNYPVVIGNKMNTTKKEIANVVGPLCTPLDKLADKMLLAKADIGDLVVILQSGAYGLSASPTAFLSHAQPAELLI